MYRLSTTSAICLARFLTSVYVSRLKGAAWPGRWQLAQFWKTMGATSLLKVNPAVAGRATYCSGEGALGSSAASERNVSVSAKSKSNLGWLAFIRAYHER